MPSDAEWDALTTAVGGSSTAGTKLKSARGWDTEGGYIPGTDDYGFSALPGGYGYWWSATEYNASDAYYRDVYCYNANVYRDLDGKAFLYSVRCVQD